MGASEKWPKIRIRPHKIVRGKTTRGGHDRPAVKERPCFGLAADDRTRGRASREGVQAEAATTASVMARPAVIQTSFRLNVESPLPGPLQGPILDTEEAEAEASGGQGPQLKPKHGRRPGDLCQSVPGDQPDLPRTRPSAVGEGLTSRRNPNAVLAWS